MKYTKFINKYQIGFLIITILILIIPSGFMTAQYSETYELVYNASNDWNNIKNFENVFIHTFGIEDGSITLSENRSGPTKDTELMLSFDHDNNEEWIDIDKLRNYELLDSEFLVSYKNKKHGSSAGRFYRLNDGVALVPSEGTIFKETESIGSFTIDFWIYFYNTYNNQIIFEKKGQAIDSLGEPMTTGISCKLYENKIEMSFQNLFYNLSSLLTDYPISEEEIKLVSKDILVPEKWYHVATSFNEHTGLLLLHINGNQQEQFWCTDDGTHSGEIFVPRFIEKENSPLTIATGLNGLIDDFHIQRNSVTEFKLSKYHKREGILKSDIIDLDYNGSSVKDFEILSQQYNNSNIVFEYRISNDYFLPETSVDKLRWIDANIDDDIPADYTKGRYLQWRVRLLAGNHYEYSPQLKSININVDYNYPPATILGLKGNSRNGLVILSWDGNIEKDIKAYKIYYGKESGNYLSDSSIITVSKSQLEDPIRPAYTLRDLEKDVVYYISVTAIDSYGNESDFSKEISVRVKY